MENSRELKSGDLWIHFKNKLYQIITVATHSETGEQFVVYQALYGDFRTYCRPVEMFLSLVDHEKYPEVTQKYRFEPIDRKDLKAGEVAWTESALKESVEVVGEDVTEANPLLLEFLDREYASDKIEYLNFIKKQVNDRLISDIAASLDLTIEEGTLDIRMQSLIQCLHTIARFETKRLR